MTPTSYHWCSTPFLLPSTWSAVKLTAETATIEVTKRAPLQHSKTNCGLPFCQHQTLAKPDHNISTLQQLQGNPTTRLATASWQAAFTSIATQSCFFILSFSRDKSWFFLAASLYQEVQDTLCVRSVATLIPRVYIRASIKGPFQISEDSSLRELVRQVSGR